MARHKHTWVVKTKDILRSGYEQTAANGIRLTKVDSAGWGENNLFYKPVIVHYACETCGEEKVVRV